MLFGFSSLGGSHFPGILKLKQFIVVFLTSLEPSSLLPLRSPLWHASIQSGTFLFSSVCCHCQFSILFPQTSPRDPITGESFGSSVSRLHPKLIPPWAPTLLGHCEAALTQLLWAPNINLLLFLWVFTNRDSPLFFQSLSTDATNMQRPWLAFG